MKKNLLAIFMLLSVLPVLFSQEDAPEEPSGKPPENPVVFDASGVFSWYPVSTYITSGKVSVEPDPLEYFNYNIQLNMGMKLFNKVSAYFNFGIDDSIANGMMNLAGAIGSKYFGVQVDYQKINFMMAWHNYKTDSDFISEFNQTWTSIALIGPRIKSRQGNLVELLLGGDLLIGVFWNTAIIPTFVYDMEIVSGSSNIIRNTVLDTNYNANIWGFRICVVQDLLTENVRDSFVDRLFATKGLWGPKSPSEKSSNNILTRNDIITCFEITVDFGWGTGSPSKKAKEEAESLNPDFTPDEESISYFRCKLRLGLGKEWQITERIALSTVIGLEYNAQSFSRKGQIGKMFTSDNMGPFLLIGTRF